MSGKPRPVRIPFADVTNGSRAGYWFLRPLEDGGFRLSWSVKSLGPEHHVQDRATAEELVALLSDRFNAFFAKQWEGYQELVQLIRDGHAAFERPGFRPGYAKRESMKGLKTFQGSFENNEKAIPLIQKELATMGWPPLTDLKFPWVLK